MRMNRSPELIQAIADATSFSKMKAGKIVSEIDSRKVRRSAVLKEGQSVEVCVNDANLGVAPLVIIPWYNKPGDLEAAWS